VLDLEEFDWVKI